MSWLERLYLTYENSRSEIGVVKAAVDEKNVPPILLPICHTTQNAQIDITIDLSGNWVQGLAKAVEKADCVTVIPCTESSASRTSGVCPHPLFDKLQYLAGDYLAYGGEVKRDGYAAYIEDLAAWCASSYAHPAVCAVYKYLQKGCLIADLLSAGVLYLDDQGKVLTKWTGASKEAPAIFKQGIEPLQAFVRVCVAELSPENWALYHDMSVRESFIQYQMSLDGMDDFCYVQGRILPQSTASPAKIRNSGDKAKLISGNDSSGFTYRGRFITSHQAANIGFITTNEAHNALKWLIAKQGWRNGDQVVLVWGTKNEEYPSIMESSDALPGELFTAERDQQAVAKAVDTEAAYAAKVHRALAGYGMSFAAEAKISVIALDSATPGRLAITYYREFGGGELFQRLNFWYGTCAWRQRKQVTDKAGKKKWLRSISAPAPLDIVKAAYGEKLPDQLKKATVERLLTCIIDGARLPRDLVIAVARQASHPQSQNEAAWNKTLSVACALLRKYHNDAINTKPCQAYNLNTYKEVYSMALDEQNKDRSYLFGRLLALADHAEKSVLIANDIKRPTNAMRLMHQFSMKPVSTWRYLGVQLTYYYQKLEDYGESYQQKIAQVMALLSAADYNNAKLDDIYLLGFYCQRDQLCYSGKNEK